MWAVACRSYVALDVSRVSGVCAGFGWMWASEERSDGHSPVYDLEVGFVTSGSVVGRHMLSCQEMEKAQERQSKAEEKGLGNGSLHSLRMLIVHLPVPGILPFVPVHYILLAL